MMRRSTGKRSGFRVLVATDGSPSARAALMTACVFPWPGASHARGVVAWPPKWFKKPAYVRAAVARSFERLGESARRQLRRHWPEAEVIFANREPVEGILGAAKRFSADVIVLGWRGHGAFRRLLMGSVSRRVVEGSPGSVLIVRRRAREIRRVVIGVDGSQNARRAVAFAAGLDRDGLKQITVVRVIEPMALPTAGLLPSSVRAKVRHTVAVLNRQLMRRARREVDSAAARLKRTGWSVQAEVRSGAPLAELLRV
ncbi:MAG: universal stress protein, partial [bacterium]